MGTEMSTEYEAVLIKKRAEIIEAIEEARGEAAEIASRIAVKEGQLKNIDDLLALESGAGPIELAEMHEAPERGRGGSLVDQAAKVLREVGKPAHYRQLVQLLADREVYVPGKDPGANLIAHISRDERFVRTGRGMYGLAEWPSVRAAKSTRRKSRSGKRSRR